MSNRHFVMVLPVLAVVAVIAGCAPAATTPSSAPSSSSAPAATPTIAPAAAPGSRVPVKCADLLSNQGAIAILGSTAKVAQDETSAPKSIEDAAAAQYGSLVCDWQSTQAEVRISIAPDAAAAYAKYAPAAMTPANKKLKIVKDTAGDSSGYWCDPAWQMADTPECQAQLLAGSYWASIEVGMTPPATATTDATQTQKLMTAVAGTLSAAPAAVPQWVSPATAAPTFCTNAVGTPKIRSILGVPSLILKTVSPVTTDAESLGEVGTYAYCYWESPHYSSASIEVLAGGSWVFPGFAPGPGYEDEITTFTPVTVPGTGGATLGCTEGACEAYFSAGTTLAFIAFNDKGATKDKAIISALAAAVKQ